MNTQIFDPHPPIVCKCGNHVAMPINRTGYVALTELGTKNAMRRFRSHQTAKTYIQTICQKEKIQVK
jgi:hypothetical protein